MGSPTAPALRFVGRFPFAERGHAPRGFAGANTYAFVATQEEDAIEDVSPDYHDDVDPFWTELVDLMARKGKGKGGKNKGNQLVYRDVVVQTDLDANQIFCEIDTALQHLSAVTSAASASSSRPSRPPLGAPQASPRLRIRSSASFCRECSRTREVSRNAEFTYTSRAHGGRPPLEANEDSMTCSLFTLLKSEGAFVPRRLELGFVCMLSIGARFSDRALGFSPT